MYMYRLYRRLTFAPLGSLGFCDVISISTSLFMLYIYLYCRSSNIRDVLIQQISRGGQIREIKNLAKIIIPKNLNDCSLARSTSLEKVES